MLTAKQNELFLELRDYILENVLPNVESEGELKIGMRVSNLLCQIEDEERSDFIDRQTFKQGATWVKGHGWLLPLDCAS